MQHADDTLGVLGPGRLGDVAVFDARMRSGHRAVIEAEGGDVVLVLRAGVALHGDAALMTALGRPDPGCETIDVCCRSKFLCLGETNGAAADKLDQTLAQITTILNDATEVYDQQAATSFAPITPIVKCQ